MFERPGSPVQLALRVLWRSHAAAARGAEPPLHRWTPRDAAAAALVETHGVRLVEPRNDAAADEAAGLAVSRRAAEAWRKREGKGEGEGELESPVAALMAHVSPSWAARGPSGWDATTLLPLYGL